MREMAEAVGFAPSVPCGIPVFKTGAFDRSATPSKLFVNWDLPYFIFAGTFYWQPVKYPKIWG